MGAEHDGDALMREVDVLRQVVYPAIIGLIGFLLPAEDPDDPEIISPPIIVTEWLARGSLDDFMSDPIEYAKLTPKVKAKIAIGIVLGMRYMHVSGVMHRDLKPGNILLDERFEVRIGDLGSARFTDLQATMTGTVRTPSYMAPEILDADYGLSVDVYSFAMRL
jgi:serine/threonine protein kinase